MTQHIFPTGGVWQFVDTTVATVTRHGCYPEVVRVDGPLSREQAHALLLATPGVRPSPERDEVNAGWTAFTDVMGWDW